MKVSYKNTIHREFSFIGSVEVDSNYPRNFWKDKRNRPVCYWSINVDSNLEDMKIVHTDISDRITSIFFAKGTKKDQDPKWELVGVDVDGTPKSETYSHQEMMNAFGGSKILDMPFNLGKNFWDRYRKIEATAPKGSSLPKQTKSIF